MSYLTGLTDLDVSVIFVANFADCSSAVDKNLSNFSGW